MSVKRYLSNFIKNMAAYKQKEDKKRDRKLELKAGGNLRLRNVKKRRKRRSAEKK